MKIPFLKSIALLTLIASALTFSSCAFLKTEETKIAAWDTAHKTQIDATLALIEAKVQDITENVLLPAVVSQIDAKTKTSFVSALSLAFRSYEGTGQLLTSSDIQSIVQAWCPDKSQWQTLGDKLAAQWAVANPTTPAQAEAVLEAFANGLNNATIVAPAGAPLTTATTTGT